VHLAGLTGTVGKAITVELRLLGLHRRASQRRTRDFPALDQNDLVFVKLLRLEAAGVWIESHPYNAEMLDRLDAPVSSTTLIQFVRFAAISYIVSSIEKTALSKTVFGLDE
jgi:hypothetical protein